MSDLRAILTSQIASLKLPLKEAAVVSLSLTVTRPTLLAALDIVDNDEVSLIRLPNQRTLYQVQGSQGAYTIYPELPLCPCPAFAQSVMYSGSHVVCKHLLAYEIALQLDKVVKREVDESWQEAYALCLHPS